MTRLLLLGAALLCLSGAGAPAAHAETVWLCTPGTADNPCELDMATTVREPSGAERVEDPQLPARRPVDCFYVYPTVSNQLTANADKSRDPELVSIAKYQAARFSQGCRVFAPIYRQRTLAALATAGAQDTTQANRIAFSDVREAWRDYLAEHNDGRGVVLIGHSQGTRMLRQLIRTEIDADPAARRRLVSAILLGGQVTVKEGGTAGGDFANVPLCTRPGEFGCAIAYSTFPYDPPANSRYGRSEADPEDPFGLPGGEGFEIACTDPSRLAEVTAPLQVLVPTEPFAPGPIAAGIVVTNGGPPPTAPTPWVVPPDRFEGGCRTIDGANVLRYEAIGDSREPNFFPDPTWGSHLIDVNLTLDRLVEIVRRQTERYLEPPLRLTRRCLGGGRLRVALAGATETVRDVNFKLDRRLAARDTRAPLTRTLSARALSRSGAEQLRAVAYLRAGAPQRVILARSLPDC